MSSPIFKAGRINGRDQFGRVEFIETQFKSLKKQINGNLLRRKKKKNVNIATVKMFKSRVCNLFENKYQYG